jgi:tetratricopeptide (TPR) repeat protein
MTKEQPNDVTSQTRLGEAYEKQGASEKAAAAFEQALKLNPKLATAVTKLAQLYAGPLRNQEKALAYAKRARELAPTDPQVASILGKVAYESGNFTWSYSLLQDAARQRENDPLILHDLAWAAYSVGKVNEARDVMQKAMTANPNSSQAADAKEFLALTALDENSKELMAAENEIQKELRSNPEYVPALMAQAALIHGAGNKTRNGNLQQHLAPVARFAPAQKRLAMLCAQDPSTVAAAYDLATKARKTLPDDPELAELLGRLSYEKKNTRAPSSCCRKRSETAARRRFSFYLGMSQLQADKRPKRAKCLIAFGRRPSRTSRDRSKTRPRGASARVKSDLGHAPRRQDDRCPSGMLYGLSPDISYPLGPEAEQL